MSLVCIYKESIREGKQSLVPADQRSQYWFKADLSQPLNLLKWFVDVVKIVVVVYAKLSQLFDTLPLAFGARGKYGFVNCYRW